MHICKFTVAQVIDLEDGNRNTLMLCIAGDNAIMITGVVVDISGNPANVNEDTYPSPIPMPTDPIGPDPTDPPADPTDPEPTPDPTPTDPPADPTPSDPSDPFGDITG